MCNQDIHSNKITNIFQSVGLEMELRTHAPDLWRETSRQLPYCPAEYTTENIEFQQALQIGRGGNWRDLSMIIFWNQRPVAIWPLSISTTDQEASISFFGGLVPPPLFIPSLANKSQKTIVKNCLAVISEITNLLKITSWQSGESFTNNLGCSLWHQQLLSMNASFRLQHELYIDLNQSIEEIKSGFRKSYKSLITSGNKLWDVNVLMGEDHAIWKEFQQLHFEVAGRKTRVDETWDIHEQHVIDKKAFLVYLRNDEKKMVGSGLFLLSHNEALYGVAAYDRSLFEKPLGHVVQFRAIEEMKKLNLNWYKIGTRSTEADQPTPTTKEISISDFKQGFASHLVPKYCATIEQVIE